MSTWISGIVVVNFTLALTLALILPVTRTLVPTLAATLVVTLTLILTPTLSGLFNPMAFLVAVQQVMARSTKQALDNTTIETHMTTFLDPTQITGDYPVDGMYMHGLFMEGARWTTPEEGAEEVYTEGHTPCRGFLMDSILKELLPPLPVM